MVKASWLTELKHFYTPSIRLDGVIDERRGGGRSSARFQTLLPAPSVTFVGIIQSLASLWCWDCPERGASLELACCSRQVTEALLSLEPPPITQESRCPLSPGQSCGCTLAGRVLPLCPSDFPNAGDFIFFLVFVLFVYAWPLPPRHPTGPAHLVATSRTRNRLSAQQTPPPTPTSVPSDQFLLFF